MSESEPEIVPEPVPEPEPEPTPEPEPVPPAPVGDPSLAPGGESGDGAVQQLIAQREIHNLNGGEDTEALADIDRQLADLGHR